MKNKLREYVADKVKAEQEASSAAALPEPARAAG
jgi:hypothetical protein